MFKRLLLCYDGSARGRAALKQGVDLAILVGAEIHMLSILPSEASDPAVVAAATGNICLIDQDGTAHELLADAVARLRERGVSTQGHLERGTTMDVIVAYAKRLAIDLIVVGHYPQPTGGRWWSGTNKTALAERVNCSVLIAAAQEKSQK